MDGVYGSLATVLRLSNDRLAWSDNRGTKITDVNADLLYKRLWFEEPVTARLDHLTQVAAACAALPADLLDAVNSRRALAARQLAAKAGHTAVAVRLTPLWRMVVGHGEDTVHETSLTMSPTYGVPIIPGSALKGVAASQARAEQREPWSTDLTRIFGTPRPRRGQSDDGAGDPAPPAAAVEADPHAEAAQGSVTVLDALPITPPAVVVDVLTPHVQPYYKLDANGVPSQPPAEYHNPVPVRFLAVQDTPFLAWLVGPAADVTRFAELLVAGADDLGIGGKTAAGYGYCTVAVEP